MGDQGGELRVAQPGKGTGDAGDDEAQHDSRSGVLRGGLAGQYKDAGADDGPDSQRNQIQRPQSAFKSALTLVLRLL